MFLSCDCAEVVKCDGEERDEEEPWSSALQLTPEPAALPERGQGSSWISCPTDVRSGASCLLAALRRFLGRDGQQSHRDIQDES